MGMTAVALRPKKGLIWSGDFWEDYRKEGVGLFLNKSILIRTLHESGEDVEDPELIIEEF